DGNMKFNEFRNGMVINHGPVVITEQEMLDYARLYDPQWFHTDPVKAKEGRWGGLIASGWQTCGLAMRMVVEKVLYDSESFGSPGVERVRWILPVRQNDALRPEITLESVRGPSPLDIAVMVRCM